MSYYVIPLIILFVLIFGLIRNVDIFSVFIEGAKSGFKTAIGILPALVLLMTCVGMFKVSGGLDILSHALSPIASLFNIPQDIVPLALIRPLSGSGALVLYEDILRTSGADTLISKIASVLMGSTETTFYTIAVYYGAVKVTKPRHTLVASISGDITGFILSSLLVLTFLRG